MFRINNDLHLVSHALVETSLLSGIKAIKLW